MNCGWGCFAALKVLVYLQHWSVTKTGIDSATFNERCMCDDAHINQVTILSFDSVILCSIAKCVQLIHAPAAVYS